MNPGDELPSITAARDYVRECFDAWSPQEDVTIEVACPDIGAAAFAIIRTGTGEILTVTVEGSAIETLS